MTMLRRAEVDGVIVAPKLASVVARHLEDEIIADGWRVGTVVGSESELLERFGVSRAVLREAVRIVEHGGSARMRRGPGGGLIVSEPNRGAVVAAMNVWFSYVGVTMSELLEVRLPLLDAAVRMAAERRSDEDVERLLHELAELEASGEVGPVAFNALERDIADTAASPAISLFVEAIGRLAEMRLGNGTAKLDPPVRREELLAHLAGYRRLINSIVERDAEAAGGQMGQLIGAVRSRLRDSRARRRPYRIEPRSSVKLAEQVAEGLRRDIEWARWPVGQLLGSETRLIERYGVSRAILREAVRILEQHGAVRTKRGPNGGVMVTAPDSDAIVRSARTVLQYERTTAAQLYEARAVVEGAAVRLAAERCEATVTAELHEALDAELQREDAAIHFMTVHRRLADATGNRVFALFTDVIGELVPAHLRAESRTADALASISKDVHAAHEKIIEAITAGDADLAEQRMLRHLRTSVDVFDQGS